MAYTGFYGGVLPPYQPPYFSQQMQSIQPQMQQQIPQVQQPVAQPAPQAQSNGLIWVQGEEGAKAYLVAPNSTVILWDSENQTIYIKSADASGIPSMRILDWTERKSGQKVTLDSVSQKANQYVTREEFDKLKAEFLQIKSTEPTVAAQSKKTAKENTKNG